MDRINFATGGQHDDPFGNGIRMAVVAFNDQAITSMPLTNESQMVEVGITSVPRGSGGVNHAAALTLGTQLLANSTGRKVMVVFTYHGATAGGDGKAEAEAARAAGIEIFGLGPETRRADLTRWVGAPKDYHLCINVGGESMVTTFDAVADRITAADTVSVDLESTLGPDFEIRRVIRTTQGSASIRDPRHLIWQVGPLGLTGPETAQVVYELRHTGTVLGRQAVTVQNRLFSPQEAEQFLGDPEVTVIAACGGGGVYEAEGVPDPVAVTVPGCTDAIRTNLGEVGMASLGRVVQVGFTLKAICPGKRVAVTVMLEELDAQGTAHSRGVKHLLLPARTGTACEDVEVPCILFSAAEALDPSGDLGSICNARRFQARVIANYTDTDYVSCTNVVVATT